MSDYDNDLIEQMVRDGIRARGGQHLGREAHPSVTMRWECERCRDQGCDFCNTPRCPACREELDSGECTNPFCSGWRFGREFDAVVDGDGEEPVIADEVWMLLAEWREDPGDGERDRGLDR